MRSLKTRRCLQKSGSILSVSLSRRNVRALLLAALGLLGRLPVCTDLDTKTWLTAAGVPVIDKPFYARGNVATAGGCLASQYLATWIILRLGSREDVVAALQRVTPVGQQTEYIGRAIEAVESYLPGADIVSAA